MRARTMQRSHCLLGIVCQAPSIIYLQHSIFLLCFILHPSQWADQRCHQSLCCAWRGCRRSKGRSCSSSIGSTPSFPSCDLSSWPLLGFRAQSCCWCATVQQVVAAQLFRTTAFASKKFAQPGRGRKAQAQSPGWREGGREGGRGCLRRVRLRNEKGEKREWRKTSRITRRVITIKD